MNLTRRISYGEILVCIQSSKYKESCDITIDKIPESFLDLTGRTHNNHLYLRYLGVNSNYYPLWLIECQRCFKLSIIVYVDDRVTETGKCSKCRSSKFYNSTDKFYKIWNQLYRKVTDPKHRFYANSGGNGYTIDPSWSDYLVFKKDMFKSYSKGLVLTVIGRSKHFSKKTAKWTEPVYNINAKNAKEIRGRGTKV